jgi:predicted NAD/FAD-binding protein
MPRALRCATATTSKIKSSSSLPCSSIRGRRAGSPVVIVAEVQALMRIAVIGGGASGLAAAWLLDGAHEVTLFERAPMLGGHVRTVGANVACAALPSGVKLDAGVIEFDRRTFTAFHAWMRELGVPCPDLQDGGSSSLLLADGRHLHSPRAIGRQRQGPADALLDAAHLIPAALRRRRFLRRASQLDERALAEMPIERLLSHDDFSKWVRALLMYAYSMHYEEVASLSAAMAVPMLQDFLSDSLWTHMPEGVSSYVEAVRRSLRAKIVLDADVRAVHRGATGVAVLQRGLDAQQFDAAVIAVPPHRVLDLLEDATDAERTWFAGYEGSEITTVLHTDTAIYERRGVRGFTEFDLFERPDRGYGYNAYLNRLAGLSEDDPPHYSLAFDMDGEIDAARVLHRQRHDVSKYTDVALRARQSLIDGNGANRTFFVGAYLGDGLHEGAVRSAIAACEKLGGRTLTHDAREDRRP